MIIEVMHSDCLMLGPIVSLLNALVEVAKGGVGRHRDYSKREDIKNLVGFLREIYCEMLYLRAAVYIYNDDLYHSSTGGGGGGGNFGVNLCGVDESVVRLVDNFPFLRTINSSNGNKNGDSSGLFDLKDELPLASLDQLILSLYSSMTKLNDSYSMMIISMVPSTIFPFLELNTRVAIQSCKQEFRESCKQEFIREKSLDSVVNELLVLLPLFIDGYMVSERALLIPILHLKVYLYLYLYLYIDYLLALRFIIHASAKHICLLLFTLVIYIYVL